MFGLFKSKAKNDRSGLSSKTIDFLNNVDEEYMYSFSTKSMKKLGEYMSRDCLVKVSQSVYSLSNKYFGASKFRKTVWTLKESDNSILTIRKDVTYDQIKVAGCVSIECAEPYSELWTYDKNSNMILDIKPV